MLFRSRTLALAACLLSGSAAAQPLGAEFRVNTYTSGDQNFAGLALDSAGNFVVVWQGHGPYGAFNGPRAQRYGSSGAPSGGEFSARSSGSYFTNGGVAVASDSAGDFVVVWSDYGVPGDDKLVLFAQRFAPGGAPIGGIFRVNTYTTSDQRGPRIAMDGTGDFVVAWVSSGEDGEKDGIFARRFAPDGSARGAEFQVNAFTTGDQTRPEVAMASSGDFVVVWQSQNGDALFSVFGRRYAGSGAVVGSEFRVNVHTGGGFYSGEPAVAAAPAGGFVVVWRTNYGTSGDVIFGRRFSAAGAPLASEFQINTSTGTYTDWASIAPLGSSGYVVAWSAGGKDKLVLGRLLSSIGTPLGPEFVVNTYTTGRTSFTSVAGNAGRKFVVTWSNDTEDGSLTGVYAQRFQALANGDANGDGFVNVGDVFYLINFLFAGGPPPVGPADVNGSLAVDVGDVFSLINFLFAGGPAPV